MSVQVRRRREAASFLSSYVGAQGELLVDTTSNRVQVHDGTAPGGWPAAGIADLPGRNALLNGNFAINQRGAASGAALAAGAYAHDRWKAGASGCTYTFAQGATDTTITIASGSLIQAVDVGNVYASAVWLTWQGTASARVWQGSASGAYAAGAAYTDPIDGAKRKLLVSALTIGTVANVEFQGGTLGLVQLEAALPCAGPTRFERRHGELALCQRYYEILSGGFGLPDGSSGNAGFFFSYQFKTTKRAMPTLVGIASSLSGFQPGQLQTSNASPAFYFSYQQNNSASFLCYISGFSGVVANVGYLLNTQNVVSANAEL